ncbi:hypothetical protein BC332_18425 [Capsicum chinense]|nr:hypothetical protein BC332_18425 [Capsicum chinense]
MKQEKVMVSDTVDQKKVGHGLYLVHLVGGHAKTLMFAHVSPEGDSFGETISTLKFPKRVSSVELGAARLNKESVEVLELKAEELPRSPTSGFKSQQAPRSPTSALKSCNAPRSPTSAAIKCQVVKTTDNRARIPSLQLPKTPEPLITSISENKAGMQSNRTISSEFQKPLTSSTHGKGSQIRISLWTIGKLINGSDRKNQQKRTEATAPLSPFSYQNEEKSSTSSNARTLRRQSLTGIPLSTMSRRSSLGGGSVPDSCANESRNCKTPGASAKLTKRWL